MTSLEDIDLDAFYKAIGFVPTHQIGEWDQGQCILPFGLHKHGDRTGKLGIHREQLYAHCFVCGSMSLINLAKAVKDLSSKAEAEEFVAKFQSGSDKLWRLYRKIDRLWPEEEVEETVIPFFNDSRLEVWEPDHPWFAERGIPPEVVKKYNLRYAPDAILGGYEGPAIIFPHYWDWKCVGWQYRWLYAPSNIPKYSFSKGFPRRETLYGWDRITNGPVVVVESVPTALRLIGRGYSAVATFGASVSDQQIKLLRSMQDGVIIAPDNDKPGRKFTRTLTTNLEPFIPLWKTDPPEGEGSDLGDVDDETITTILERRQSIYVY